LQLLLDSNVVLWWLNDDDRLSDHALALVDDALNDVVVSVASVWELGIKAARGKLEIPGDYLDVLDEEGIQVVGISVPEAQAAAALPLHHNDPFDRMLIAQAQLGGYAIVTSDRAFAAYGVATVSAR
jgi:PIN domain nuclease of toxin-antitoxin system